MVQMSPTRVNTRTMGSAGQITISTSALTQLGLVDGDQLLELVVGGVLVYIPATADVLEAQDRFVHALAAHGIAPDDLLADIEQHKDEVYEALYGTASS